MLIIQYWIFKKFISLHPAFLYGKARKSEIENEKVQAV